MSSELVHKGAADLLGLSLSLQEGCERRMAGLPVPARSGGVSADGRRHGCENGMPANQVVHALGWRRRSGLQREALMRTL